jgi:hypothetical protein
MADIADFGDGNTFQVTGAYHWAPALGASPAQAETNVEAVEQSKLDNAT